MKRITKWYKTKINDQGDAISISFNHYEDGWNTEGIFPPPFNEKFGNQVAWSKETWLKEYCYMNEQNKIIGSVSLC